MKTSQSFRYALLHRVPYLVVMAATIVCFTGATWTIDQPMAPSTRTTTATVTGTGTSDSPGTAVFRFGYYTFTGYVVEKEDDVTANEIGNTGMYEWSCTLDAPPWKVGTRKGARIAWTGNHADTSFHEVIQ